MLSEISEKVFLKRPVLKEIAEKYSGVSLKDYVQKYWDIPVSRPEQAFISVLEEESSAIHGQALSSALVAQLMQKALVSSVDHLGIWNHPFFVNSNLIYSLYFGKDEFMPVLATESVSLNNSSWPGALLCHNSSLVLERHSFFPDKLKMLSVFSAPAILPGDIKRFMAATNGRFDNLIQALNFDRLPPAQNFSVQACRISSEFWQNVFPSAPKLVYLPLETIISKYLLKIFEDPNDVVSRIILTQEGRRLWDKYFANEHTFMFWAVDGKGRRQALKFLPEKSGELLELIGKRRVYPSSPLCFMVLLKAGLACAGGFTQTTWLSEIKEKLAKLFVEMELDCNKITAISTKNFSESSLAWLKIGEQYLTPTAADLYLTGKDYYPKYLKLAGALTLGQSLNLAMPTIYSVVKAKQQQAGFDINFVRSEVFEALGMDELLKDAGI